MLDDLLVIRTPGVNFHVLKDDSGLCLLDAGFIGGQSALANALRRRGWSEYPIRGIILTHGHLDHILNVQAIAQQTGAWIAAPQLDAAHYAGKPYYRGWARVTGILERVGRRALHYQPFLPGRWINDDDVLPVWHSLRAVHLPGHTAGHTGFYCERLNLLFSADLFASYAMLAHLPPRIFNSHPQMIIPSLEKALRLELCGVIPNHGDLADPAEHLRRLRRLQVRYARGENAA